jgi:hypothetical protein
MDRPTLFTIEALATETGRDRRTVAKALRGVTPDGQVKGREGYLLNTALKALNARSGASYRSGGGNATPDEAVRVARKFEAALEKASQLPDITERRKILIEAGPLFGQLCGLLEQGADETPGDENEKWLLTFVREQILADALATFYALGCWQVAGAPLLPVESLLEAQRQGVDVGSIK